MPSVTKFQGWYNTTRTWFAIINTIICPVTFLVDAPFGRFTPSQSSILLVDGIKSWIFMELVSPLTFIFTYMKAPLSAASSPSLRLSHPPTFLSALFLLHYLNRAVISPLRTPSRSKSHIMVPASGVLFNLANGALLGAYFSSPGAAAFLAGAFARPTFWAGVALWVAGLAGNVLHDEVLLDLRRSARTKGKARADGAREDDASGKTKSAHTQEHYAVPHGYLYALVSYPNYLCEWVEWAGFALAAAPAPSVASLPALLGSLSPPWLFVLSEVLLMLPRAYKGHLWYHRRFPDYPKERKAVIPFVF